MNASVGDDIRALRKVRGLTLQDLASRVNRSVGWLSQVERGKGNPTADDLAAISGVLDCRLSLLFDNSPGPEIERGMIVRAENRREMSSMDGLREELLSPDLTDSFEVVRSVFAPGAKLEEPCIRPTQEVGYLISGRLEMMIAGRPFSLNPGDSFRIRGEAYTWANPYREPAVAIWVISPPIY